MMMFVETLVYPEKVGPGLTALDVFCNHTDLLDSFLVKTADSEADMKWLAEPICHHSLDSLRQEIGGLLANDPNFFESLVWK